MRLYVDELGVGGAGEGAHGADLIGDVVLQLLRRDVDPPPPEPEEVRQGDVRADVDAKLLRHADDAAHDGRIAAMESGGDVRRRHQRQDAGVVAERPAPESFAHVAVDVEFLV